MATDSGIRADFMMEPVEGEYYEPFDLEDTGGHFWHQGNWYEVLSAEEAEMVTIH